MTDAPRIFHADLHVHSRYSRATSRDLDLERLAGWAALKGIAVIGTGDCLHPAWFAEIGAKLIADGTGLFRLAPDLERAVLADLPPSCRSAPRFLLSTEIATIQRKDDRARKVHHLVYLPDPSSALRLAGRLGRLGDIASDGRPVLKLDARELLEAVLETGPDCHLVPAHIWTPWFSVLGARSGFESVDECYGDLAPHIFAVETGLSSDPAMNWRVSALDRFRLVSNSDAHSPSRLGRETTLLSCPLDYGSIFSALRDGTGYHGTTEFFPEEGKYHLDGHRDCQVSLTPAQTLAQGGLCPVCQKPVTVGVAHRLAALADRNEGAPPPETAGIARSLVPLGEILAEITGRSEASKTVMSLLDRARSALGPELPLLEKVPILEIARVHPLLGEAIARLRAGHVHRVPGYDGVYGRIRLFGKDELDGAKIRNNSGE